MVWYNKKISYVFIFHIKYIISIIYTRWIGHVLFQHTLLHSAFTKFDDTIGLITVCPPHIDHGSLTRAVKSVYILISVKKTKQMKQNNHQIHSSHIVNIFANGQAVIPKFGCIKTLFKNIIVLF